MNRKQLTPILILAVIFGGLGYHFYNKQKDSYQSSDAVSGQKLLPNFPINDIAHVLIKQGTNQLNLVKQDDVWKVRERYDYPANFTEIGDLLRKFWEMKTVQAVKAGQSQLGRLELNSEGANSGTVVDFRDKAGKTTKSVMLGKKYMRESEGGGSPFGGGGGFPVGRYVMVVENPPKVWLISDALSNIETKPESWLNKDFFKVEKIRSVAVAGGSVTNSWKLTRDTETGEFKLADAAPNEVADSGKSSGAGHVLSSPSFSDILAPDITDEASGLDKATAATIETFDGFTYTVKLGKTGADDNYNLKFAVTGSFAKERTPGKDEKPEDKDKLDKEFKESLAKLETKLKQEKQYEKWTYVVAKWSIDALLKDRKELLKEEPKKEEAKPDEGKKTEGLPVPIPGIDPLKPAEKPPTPDGDAPPKPQ